MVQTLHQISEQGAIMDWFYKSEIYIVLQMTKPKKQCISMKPWRESNAM